MALPSKLTKTDAASLLSITRVTLDRRINAGVYSWPLADMQTLVAEHVDYELSGRVDSDEGEKLIAARRRKIELEIAQIEGDLLPADDVRAGIEMMIVNCRSRLLAIPHALAQTLRPDEPAVAYQLLEGAIHEALHELADRSFGTGNGHA